MRTTSLPARAAPPGRCEQQAAHGWKKFGAPGPVATRARRNGWAIWKKVLGTKVEKNK